MDSFMTKAEEQAMGCTGVAGDFWKWHCFLRKNAAGFCNCRLIKFSWLDTFKGCSRSLPALTDTGIFQANVRAGGEW